jgi:hypothetical protein
VNLALGVGAAAGAAGKLAPRPAIALYPTSDLLAGVRLPQGPALSLSVQEAAADLYTQIDSIGVPEPIPPESVRGAGAAAVWQEKLDYLRTQEAILSDPAQRFTVAKQIAEAEEKLRELQSGRLAAPPARWTAASRRVVERYAAEIATRQEAASERGQAVQEGRTRALQYVVDLLKTTDPSDVSGR